ncbi:hypothetical protein CVT24_001619 [Panaeolus cyanescens]|uniref:Uncharacterized protein n=1 Tax=Panaeolus cyanescens TaxID=181874 RepID=A0A409WUV5_9AGAR|nr:hypothetical protein CVT24_001619 [Panaeolus cyanescens]
MPSSNQLSSSPDPHRSPPRMQNVPVDVQDEVKVQLRKVDKPFGFTTLPVADIKKWNDAWVAGQRYLLDEAHDEPLSTLIALHDAGYITREQIAQILHNRLTEITLKRFCLSASDIDLFILKFGAKLSGSVLIRLIHPKDDFEPDDLDFYIEAAVETEAIQFFVEQGYLRNKPQFDANRSTSSQSQTNYSYPHSNSYTRLYRMCLPPTHGSRSINLIVSNGKSVLPILCFHSTGVMNFLSHHGLVILYPDTTLKHISIPNTPGSISDMAPLAQVGVRKYESRGWTYKFADQLFRPHECSAHPYCPQMTRSLHDSAVLRVPSLYYALQDDVVLHEAYRKDAMIAHWSLAGGNHCLRPTSASNNGHAYVDGKSAVGKHIYLLESVITMLIVQYSHSSVSSGKK